MATETTSAECAAKTDGGTWAGGRLCGKPAKGTLADGTPACGIHLATERKRIQRAEEYQLERAQQGRLLEAAKAACVNLSGFGINAAPEWSAGPRGTGYTGRIVASPGEIMAAIGAAEAR